MNSELRHFLTRLVGVVAMTLMPVVPTGTRGILDNGMLPLDVLDNVIDDWISEQLKAA